jgi:hypothetical protein
MLTSPNASESFQIAAIDPPRFDESFGVKESKEGAAVESHKCDLWEDTESQ